MIAKEIHCKLLFFFIFFDIEDLIFLSLNCFEQWVSQLHYCWSQTHKLIPVVSNHLFPYQFHCSEVMIRAVLLLFFRKILTQF